MGLDDHDCGAAGPPGWPIYADPVERNLPDPCAANDTDWHPSTDATNKLWRCFAALQKIGYLLEGSGAGMPEARVRRFLVQFVVPLDGFFICVRDLGGAIEDDSQGNLEQAELAYVAELRKRFREAVLDESRPVKLARNKIGAHTDSQMHPAEVTGVVSALDIHMVGALLHASLLTLKKLCELDCYAWTSKGHREGEVRLMTCEPFVLSISTDDPHDLRSIEMAESPKRHVIEKVADIVERTAWMFAEDQPRLVARRDPSDPSATTSNA